MKKLRPGLVLFLIADLAMALAIVLVILNKG
jgi:hypothetical protein